MAVADYKTVFLPETYFDPPPEDGVMVILPFLLKVEKIIRFLESLGKVFVPVVKDMDGNVRKLREKNAENPEKFTTINAMLDDEKEKQKKGNGTIGGVWLARALHFICDFFDLIVKDHESGTCSNSLSAIMEEAHKNALKQYQNAITRGLFWGGAKLLSNRKDLLAKLVTKDVPDDQICEVTVKELKAFLYEGHFKGNMEAFLDIFNRYGVNK